MINNNSPAATQADCHLAAISRLLNVPQSAFRQFVNAAVPLDGDFGQLLEMNELIEIYTELIYEQRIDLLAYARQLAHKKP